MKLCADRAHVEVPGSVVGFGSAYGTLAVAIAPTDKVIVRAVAGPTRITGGGALAGMTDPQKHPTVVALRALLDQVGASQVGVRLDTVTNIPRGAGLGAYAAEVVAGALAARTLLGDPDELDFDFILNFVVSQGVSRLRALVALGGGGAIATAMDEASAFRVGDTAGLDPIAFVPGFTLDERSDVGPEPLVVHFADAKRAASSLALQVGLLSGAVAASPALLFEATHNALAAEQLSVSSPASSALVSWLREQDIPAFVSSLGPAVVCLSPVSDQITDAARRAGWEPLPVAFTGTGAL